MNILVIGLIDSVHLSRWLEQFSNSEYKFLIFPSKKFKHPHPDLINLLRSYPSRFSLAEGKYQHFLQAYGYIDFLQILLGNRFMYFNRESRLKFVLHKNRFDLIHAIEFQGAAYLLLDAVTHIDNLPKIIVTNYGSDIVFFEKEEEHRQKIERVLQIADYYSAECKRDYELAERFGFVGKFLPCIPNAGGFSSKTISQSQVKASERSIILVKCIGGTFGLGSIALEAVDTFMKLNTKYQVCLYSVTDDLVKQANELKSNYPERVEIIKRTDQFSRVCLLEKFSRSRVYLGCSASDGISTSFLESIVHGAYPIQTNTSCAQEWLSKGFIGSTPNPVSEEILKELIKTNSDELVDHAQLQNQALALTHLSDEVILKSALTFYNI